MKTISVPFRVTGGKISTTNSPRTIAEQKIINVLTTNPLERVGTQGYGVGVQAFLFEPIDDLVEADFKTDALLELNTRISGAEVLDIVVKEHDFEEGTVTFNVYYRTPLASTQMTSFTVSTLPFTEESPI